MYCNGRVSVCPSVRPSVRLSHLSTATAACGGFAAGRLRAGGIDRQKAPALSSNGAAARRSAANADIVDAEYGPVIFRGR